MASAHYDRSDQMYSPQETIESMRKQLGEAQDREAKSSERIDVLESDLFRANSRLSSLSAEWSESEKQLVNDAQEKKKLEDAIQHGESIIQAVSLVLVLGRLGFLPQ